MTPSISIGLVVRNGAAHLDDALDSWRAQTATDFELVVHDNASTDDTPAIVRRHADADPRIRLVRRTFDLGVVGNFVAAARAARAPRFAWAAHDDLRESTFLETLTTLLDDHPEAAVACCGARDLDPDGTRRTVRHDTDDLTTTRRMAPVDRLRMYFAARPCTPIYGLYRTSVLQDRLDALAAGERPGGRAPLAGDVVFLADFLVRHHLAFTPDPLLLFRAGGHSHRVDAFDGLVDFAREAAAFRRRLLDAVDPGGPEARLLAEQAVATVCLGRSMHPVLRHQAIRSMPWLQRGAALGEAVFSRDLARLRTRLNGMAPNRAERPVRMALLGAGKHTARRLAALEAAVRGRAEILAVVDDDPSTTYLGSCPVITPDRLDAFRPQVLLVSSDTYEARLLERGRAIAPPGCRVWCLYDQGLEHAPPPEPDATSRDA